MEAPTVDALRKLAACPLDSAAWSLISDRHRTHLLALASKCCSDVQTADDVVQEALILARRDAYQFTTSAKGDPERQAQAWLAGITVHCARRQMRAALRRAARHRRATQDRPALVSQSPADIVVEHETAGLVRAAVAGLPATTASAVSLRYFSDMDYTSIAQALHITEATARKRVQRGIRTLRQRLRRVGCVLSLLALIRQLHAALPAWSSSTLPQQLVQPRIVTMPRLCLLSGCVLTAYSLLLLVGVPDSATAAETAEASPVPSLSHDSQATTVATTTDESARSTNAEHAPAALVAANASFALKLYQRLAAAGKEDVVLGSASISQALALAEAGAKGPTQTEFHTTLGWTGLEAQLHPAWKHLTDTWNSSTGIDLAIVNRLYSQKGDPFNPDYLERCRTMHQAEPQACDFTGKPDQERKAINAWVSEQTRARIPELLKPGSVTTDTRSVLVNACYFKGQFLSPFKTKMTVADTPFHSATGIVPCAMMHQSATLQHMSDAAVDVVRLAYGDRKTDQASAHLTLIVPKAVDGLAAVEASLSAEQLAAWTTGLTGKRLDLALPRFTSRTPVLLKKHLQSLGLERAFDVRADFSGMNTGSSFISEVIHEAWIATDEAGSEAAAATAAVMDLGLPPEPTVQITADRPFVWIITDASTGSLLFLGRVSKPSDPGPAEPEDD